MTAPKAIRDLVARYEEHHSSYLTQHYNEAQTRKEFIDPFFAALGWDMENRQQWAEAYKEVIHEDSIKIAGEPKAPDYCFRIGGVRKFFVEAKKPSTNITRDVAPPYQIRRYAWSSKLPLSVLTNFEHFALYDCRVEPKMGDRPATARVMLLSYRDYEPKWDGIATILSRDAIPRGSFDAYADSNKAKRGTAEVDRVFLGELDHWRDLLARGFASHNRSLTQRELNFAVQQTVDRIVFLRISEECRTAAGRGIGPSVQLGP